jgi:hypothetical protein
MMYKMAIQVLLEQTENEEVLMVPGRSCREDVFWAGWSAFGSLLVNVYLFFSGELAGAGTRELCMLGASSLNQTL